MEIINTLLGDLDPSVLVPELDTLTGWLQLILSLAANVGPIAMLIMGIIYVVAPPKEATHKAGFRTYFGMGSIQAWRFSQLPCGGAIALMGLVLTIIAKINSEAYALMPIAEGALATIELVKGQIISIAVLYVVMFIAMAVIFDSKGKCRFGWKLPFATQAPPTPEEEEDALLPEEEEEETLAVEELFPEYFREESAGPLQVEDIVIEGISDEEHIF